jgi:hypothetical protein
VGDRALNDWLLFGSGGKACQPATAHAVILQGGTCGWLLPEIKQNEMKQKWAAVVKGWSKVLFLWGRFHLYPNNVSSCFFY